MLGPKIWTLDQYIADPALPLSDYDWQFIAEGDSWYSITDPDLLNQNLLDQLRFGTRSAIINAARPGDIAGAMFTKNAGFKTALQGQWWLGVLISASGNDMIDALQVTPKDPATGRYRPEKQRLLRTAEETEDPLDPLHYVIDEGFAQLAGYLLHWFGTLVQWRDAAGSRTAGRPIFMHDYAIPVPRPAGVLVAPNAWLHAALTLYGIDPALHTGIANILFGKLRGFLTSLDSDSVSPYRLPAFHVFDSAAVHLEPATAAHGPSGDWVNEIHLTTDGAEKVGRAYSAFIENRFSRYAMPSRVSVVGLTAQPALSHSAAATTAIVD